MFQRLLIQSVQHGVTGPVCRRTGALRCALTFLDRLGNRHRPAPTPTVYRALQFLQERGLVHRLERLNAFVGCARPHPHHQGQFLICGDCGSVREIEAPALTTLVEENARREGFSPQRQTIEVHGTCSQCA